MDPFAMALDAQFRAPGSMAATFTAAGGDPVAIRTIRSSPDALSRFGQGSVIQTTNVFEIRVSEVAEPESGDIIVVGEERFAIFGDPIIDDERLTWRCGAEPLA